METKSIDSLIIPAKEADQLLEQGYYKTDLHIHSYYSDCVAKVDCLSPLAICKLAYERKLKLFSITDHDTMAPYDELGQREGLVPGVEVTILDKKRIGYTAHMLVWELNKKQFEELEDIAQKDKNMDNLIDCADAYGLELAPAHIYWAKPGERITQEGILYFLEHPKIKKLETSGSVIWPYIRFMDNMAEKYGKALLMTNDSHIGRHGFSYALGIGETRYQFWRNVDNRKVLAVPKHLNNEIVREQVKIWLYQFFEENRVKLKDLLLYPKTDVKVIDELIRFFYHGSEKPLIGPVLKHFVYALVHTLPFEAWYLNRQFKKWTEIENSLPEELLNIV